MTAPELEAKSPNRTLRADGPASQRLPMPKATQPVRIDWGYVCSIVGIHVLSLLMFVPWYFSWTGVVVAILGFPLYGLFGITLCYHHPYAPRADDSQVAGAHLRDPRCLHAARYPGPL